MFNVPPDLIAVFLLQDCLVCSLAYPDFKSFGVSIASFANEINSESPFDSHLLCGLRQLQNVETMKLHR